MQEEEELPAGWRRFKQTTEKEIDRGWRGLNGSELRELNRGWRGCRRMQEELTADHTDVDG